MLSHRLACEAADVFRAVASVAGTDATTRCVPSRPISVLHIHARDDDHVLFDGGAGAGAFRDESKVMSFVSVPETISRWVKRDHCAAPPQRTLDKAGAYCESHSGCAGGTQVQLCVTETGGHSWPGAASVRRGKEAASQALDANDVIWRFFEQASR
jgi:polyhydroxybutyrate depolymerase